MRCDDDDNDDNDQNDDELFHPLQVEPINGRASGSRFSTLSCRYLFLALDRSLARPLIDLG